MSKQPEEILVAISDGHEMHTAGKRTPVMPDGSVIHENQFNKAVALLLEADLKRLGFKVINVSSTANDSLADRVNRANAANADIFVAIHYNAFDGKFDAYDPEGISVHIYGKGGEAEKLAIEVHKFLIQGTSQKDRGIVVSNFYVLRNTKMPAILTENGFMDNLKEAQLMLDPKFQAEVASEHSKGICSYFGVKYQEQPSVHPGTMIMGTNVATAAQLKAYLLSKNPNPKINLDLDQFCKLWISESAAEGVRGDIGFCQACHETGYFKYGGIVLPDQNNYGGIGALNGNAAGQAATFESPLIGIRASIQHLKAYGSKDPLKNPVVDPRFQLVTRGIAPNFEDLGGRWAWPGYDKKKYSSLDAAKAAGDTYGHYIIKKYDDLIKIKVQDPDPLPDLTPDPIPVKELDPRIKEVEQLLQSAIAILQSIN